MKYTQNREDTEQLSVDLLGFIFYPKSKRFVGEIPEIELFETKKSKVGVFVDQNVFEILPLAKKFGLEYIQLHGKENQNSCQILKNQGLKIIKAFNIDEKFDFNTTQPFEKACRYFLFDTKTDLHGGSGKKFDWQILEKYQGHTPFFLSGGIGSDDAVIIKAYNHPKLTGIDLNSGFEDSPGMKNIDKLEHFIKQITM